MLSPQDALRMRSASLVLDVGTRQLRRGTNVIPVTGLPLRILELLMAADGRMVTREELKAKLWPYAVRIDVDRRLNTAIRALRRAIEEASPEAGRIVTVRGYGYRWVAARRSGRKLGHLTLAAALALVVTGAFITSVRQGSTLQHTRALAMVGAADRKLAGDWDWRGAEALYRNALATEPGLVEAHRGLAWLYVNERRTGNALPHIARLLEAPDRTPARRAELGWLLMRARKPDAALAICSKPDKNTINLLSCRHTALAQLGLVPEARDTAVELLRAASADQNVIRSVRDAEPSAGYVTFLRWRVAHFVAPQRDWFRRAQLQAEAGLYKDALDSLEIAAARRDPLLIKIASTAAFAPLQSSPRFQRIAAIVLDQRAA